MTPEQFIDKWTRADRTERQAAQEHFIDLCRVLGEPTPNEADDPDAYSFEKGAAKTDGRAGFADVWKRGCFGWEYKKDRANLDLAYQQLQLYSVALENPPLLVVSDTKRFRVYTNWTNTVQEKHDFTLEGLAHTETRDLLRNVFRHPERLQPKKTREQVTKDVAKDFSTIAERLRMAGHAPEMVAHFLNRIVFCLFAEDVNLLPNDLFKEILKTLAQRREQIPQRSQAMLAELFGKMRGGGHFGRDHILHFNGGLFDDDEALPLDADSLDMLRVIARQDWSSIDPSIFGTLFERFLDPDTKLVGVHYTDPEKIMMIVEPVIMRPLIAEWEAEKAELAAALAKGRRRDGTPGPRALVAAEERFDKFLVRLAAVRVLDPACGSGNFLYLALQSLKDLEYRVILEAEMMGLVRRVVHCGPRNVKGIEINQYAAELARTSIWIGDIQWKRRNGFEAKDEPVLEALDAIECRDALVTCVVITPAADYEAPFVPGKTDLRPDEIEHFVEAKWPEAEFIVGNPPFLGDKKIAGRLDKAYVAGLRETYSGRVGGNADLVCYWFEKAKVQVETGVARRAGLVATNTIRRGANRRTLDRIASVTRIFEAWSDEKWVVEGAAVRVSLICFGQSLANQSLLDGQLVARIHPDLTAGTIDITKAARLRENKRASFLGVQKSGPLDVPGSLAREWLLLPQNPNGKSNAEILRPFWNGDDITSRSRDYWLIDFPHGLTESGVALYQQPFEYLKAAQYQPDDAEDLRTLQEARKQARDKHAQDQWWEPYWPRPEMRSKIAELPRYIVTPETPTYTVFAWLPASVIPDKNLIVVTRDDDTSFGILHSKAHLVWVRALGSPYGNHPTARRYNSSRVFETFPFPEGLTPNIPAKDYADDPRAIAIATAAKRLDELRSAWLNPPDLIDIVPEVVPGYPDRILPKTEAAAVELKKRTLTNLYNARPQWLADAHRDLDAAVAAAYGWRADISEEDALAKLLELNLSRAGAKAKPQRDDDDEDDPGPALRKEPLLTRKEFAKISEVESLRLSDAMREAFEDFDVRKLPAEERRQAIIDRFKRAAK